MDNGWHRGIRTLFVIALLFSLFLHGAMFWLFAHTDWIALLSAPAAQPNEEIQMVDLVEPANRIRPTTARHVGVENNATTQETVATPRPKPPRPTPQATNAQSEHRVPSTDHGMPTTAMREPLPMRPKLPRTAVSEDLGHGLDLPLPEDYFPDYQHGGHTYLNVLKRPGIDYFVQLKRIFKMAWDPVPALRAHFAANEVSRGSVKVVLAVSVDRSGNLSELFLLKGSGLARYDQEALRTVRASSPFSSPPPNLLTADGTLHMSWTFIVYL